MGYVESKLMTGEQVVYEAKIHRIMFAPGVLLVAFGIFLFAMHTSSGASAVLGVVSLLGGIGLLLRACIHCFTTELAVTTKRVIARSGFFRPFTMELNHNNVESFHVLQTSLGHFFGFGTLIVHGTDGDATPVPNIEAPLLFHRKAMQAIDESRSR